MLMHSLNAFILQVKISFRINRQNTSSLISIAYGTSYPPQQHNSRTRKIVGNCRIQIWIDVA